MDDSASIMQYFSSPTPSNAPRARTSGYIILNDENDVFSECMQSIFPFNAPRTYAQNKKRWEEWFGEDHVEVDDSASIQYFPSPTPSNASRARTYRIINYENDLVKNSGWLCMHAYMQSIFPFNAPRTTYAQDTKRWEWFFSEDHLVADDCASMKYFPCPTPCNAPRTTYIQDKKRWEWFNEEHMDDSACMCMLSIVKKYAGYLRG